MSQLPFDSASRLSCLKKRVILGARRYDLSIGKSNGLFHRRRVSTLSPTPRHRKPSPNRSPVREAREAACRLLGARRPLRVAGSGRAAKRRLAPAARVSILGAVFVLLALLWLLAAVNRSPSRAGVVRAQPVPCSHKHYVQGLGIDCRDHHTSAAAPAFAILPSTETCMTCLTLSRRVASVAHAHRHSQVHLALKGLDQG